MADAVITLKLTPDEYRCVRAALVARKEDAHEHAREVRGEDPKLARTLEQEEAELGVILTRI